MLNKSIYILTVMANSVVFAQKPIKFITLDPGHFHAALVQNKMYENVIILYIER